MSLTEERHYPDGKQFTLYREPRTLTLSLGGGTLTQEALDFITARLKEAGGGTVRLVLEAVNVDDVPALAVRDEAAAAEREECAKIAERVGSEMYNQTLDCMCWKRGDEIAESIRERSTEPAPAQAPSPQP